MDNYLITLVYTLNGIFPSHLPQLGRHTRDLLDCTHNTSKREHRTQDILLLFFENYALVDPKCCQLRDITDCLWRSIAKDLMPARKLARESTERKTMLGPVLRKP